MKGLADEALKMSAGKKKDPEPEESDPLELAVSEFFEATEPSARAAAFRAAVEMCRGGYDDKE